MVRVNGISSFRRRHVDSNCVLTITKKVFMARFKWYVKRRVRNDIIKAEMEAAERFEEILNRVLAEYY